MENKTEVPVISESQETRLATVDPNSYLMDVNKFEHIQRIARVFSNSDMVPVQYRNKDANCIIATQMAFRMGLDPFMFMQSSYVVHGNPGIESKLAIALVNERGPFEGPIQWRFEGEPRTDEWKCVAYAKHRKTQEICEAEVSWTMVKGEGWLDKGGSKWKTMPELMFRYRSAMFLARLYAPEVLMGFQTVDELYDVGPQTVQLTSEQLPPEKPSGTHGFRPPIKGEEEEQESDEVEKSDQSEQEESEDEEANEVSENSEQEAEEEQDDQDSENDTPQESKRLSIQAIQDVVELYVNGISYDELADVLEFNGYGIKNLKRSLDTHVEKGNLTFKNDKYFHSLNPQGQQIEDLNDDESSGESSAKIHKLNNCDHPVEEATFNRETKKWICGVCNDEIDPGMARDIYRGRIFNILEESPDGVGLPVIIRKVAGSEGMTTTYLGLMVKNSEIVEKNGLYYPTDSPALKQSQKKDKRPPREVISEIIELNPFSPFETIKDMIEDYDLHLPDKNLQGILDDMVENKTIDRLSDESGAKVYRISVK